jgi:hypothetical protein
MSGVLTEIKAPLQGPCTQAVIRHAERPVLLLLLLLLH